MDGKIVALQAGEIANPQKSGEKAITLFTNREGKFFLEGLKPGKYELRMHADQSIATGLEIPKDKSGLYDLGAVRLSEQIKFD